MGDERETFTLSLIGIEKGVSFKEFHSGGKSQMNVPTYIKGWDAQFVSHKNNKEHPKQPTTTNTNHNCGQ